MNSQALREGRGTSESQAPPVVRDVLRSPGHALDRQTRASMESHFGRDFSAVRVHSDDRAARSAEAMNARAYTVGNHIAFGKGPRDGELLEHELTHVVQQMRGERTVQCAPDPLCAGFNLPSTKMRLATQTSDFLMKPETPRRHAVIRTIKLIDRCVTDEKDKAVVRDQFVKSMKSPAGEKMWAEAATPFGGYTALHAGYAGGGGLKGLGASEILATPYYRTAFLEEPEPADVKAAHRSRAKSTASGMVDELESSDILYFIGHHYGRYRAPGVFSRASKKDELDETAGFDLRYIEKKGGFPNVKVLITTSCSTLCTEAFQVFHNLFPNAALLGYLGTAPFDGGAVRADFNSRLTKPLILEPGNVDVHSMVSAWKATIAKLHKGAKNRPGYWDGSKMEYWDGAAWQPMDPLHKDNNCPKTADRDRREELPGPR